MWTGKWNKCEEGENCILWIPSSDASKSPFYLSIYFVWKSSFRKNRSIWRTSMSTWTESWMKMLSEVCVGHFDSHLRRWQVPKATWLTAPRPALSLYDLFGFQERRPSKGYSFSISKTMNTLAYREMQNDHELVICKNRIKMKKNAESEWIKDSSWKTNTMGRDGWA